MSGYPFSTKLDTSKDPKDMDAYELAMLLEARDWCIDTATTIAVQEKLKQLAPYEYPDIEDSP